MLEKELKIVEKFKQLVTRQVKVHEVRVFGSRARGDATEDSDLDVLVVVGSEPCNGKIYQRLRLGGRFP